MIQLTPQILKPAVSKALVELTAPIRAAYEESKEWRDITLKAYPPPEKKVKKVKDKGSRHPGNKPAEGKPTDATEVQEAAAKLEQTSL